MAVLVTSMWTQGPQPQGRQLETHLRQLQEARTTQFLLQPMAEEAVPILPRLHEKRAHLPQRR